MADDYFNCYRCDGVFKKIPGHDAVADEERDRVFPDIPPGNECMVCGDCYRELMGQFN